MKALGERSPAWTRELTTAARELNEKKHCLREDKLCATPLRSLSQQLVQCYVRLEDNCQKSSLAQPTLKIACALALIAQNRAKASLNMQTVYVTFVDLEKRGECDQQWKCALTKPEDCDSTFEFKVEHGADRVAPGSALWIVVSESYCCTRPVGLLRSFRKEDGIDIEVHDVFVDP